jgi:serine phosphatase RsbU (regulator of sigma subunit)
VVVDGSIDPAVAGAVSTVLAASISLLAAEADTRRIIANDALDNELAIGRRIQRSLMPRRFPELPGWEIAAAYEAAREVGGDLYDAFPLRGRPGMLAFTVADVTGKGIPAAILMADARALIHAAADHAADPVDSLERVNRVLRQERGTTLFVTVAHGTIVGATGEVTLAGAGHEPLHVVHPDGGLETLELGGRMVGMVADLGAHATSVTLAPGDALVIHTDGVTEARSPDGGFYGDDRFEALLRTLGDRSASEVVDAVVSAVADFRAGAEPSDDLTLLVLRRLPEGVAAG